jgi:hypothetical protein
MGNHEEGHGHEDGNGIFFENRTAGFAWLYVLIALGVIASVLFL